MDTQEQLQDRLARLLDMQVQLQDRLVRRRDMQAQLQDMPEPMWDIQGLPLDMLLEQEQSFLRQDMLELEQPSQRLDRQKRVVRRILELEQGNQLERWDTTLEAEHKRGLLLDTSAMVPGKLELQSDKLTA